MSTPKKPAVVMPERIVMRPTASLVKYARNSRTHDQRQVEVLAKSITDFGFTNPILVDGDRGVIAGHGRIMAAELIGLPEVPCIELRHLTDEQKRAYLILDNQSSLMSGWNEALLAQELADLSGVGFEAVDLGFDAAEVDRLMETLGVDFGAKAEGDPDAVPEAPVVPTSKLGDVWLLGRHRVMCGDSTDRAQVERLMDGKKAALCHADPPYGMGKQSEGVLNDNLYRDKLDAFQMRWWTTFRPHLLDNASAYIWGNAPDLWRLWWRGGLSESERLTFRNEIVWNKKTASAGGISHMGADNLRQYPQATERCLFFMLGEQGFNINADNYWEGWESIRSYLDGEREAMGWNIKDTKKIAGHSEKSGCHWFDSSQWSMPTESVYSAWQSAAEGKAFRRDYEALKREFYATRAFFDNTHENMTDVWDFDRVTGDERHGHATPKPVPMMERVMRSSLPADGLCVEPFGGSGSTLMGAEKTGRVCYTMELTPAYVDVIVRRWQDFTGKTATLDGDGRTFAEIEEVRRAAH